MARNGSGQFNLITNSWYPPTNGVSATAVDWQALIDDVASAITQSVSADGQTPISGNLNMGGNVLTSLGAGVATGQSLRWQQLFDQGVEVDVASAATTDIGVQNSNFIRVTGTTTITSFGTNYRGPRFVRFGGALTLTHNAATLILPGGANITTGVGDRAILTPVGSPASGWQVVAYEVASLAPGTATSATTATTLSGVVAIVNGGTGQTTAAAAFNAIKQAATESASGALEISTVAESQALTDNTVAITPARLVSALQGANQSLATTGYQRMPGGLIIQWGNISLGTGSNVVTFPLTFPTAAYSVVVTAGNNNGANNTTSFVNPINLGDFTLNNATGVTSNWKWIAIGR